MEFIRHYHSPLGDMTAASDGESLTGLWFDGQKYFPAGLPEAGTEESLPVFEQTERWLEIYFSGKVPDFLPPLAPRGSEFRLAVWRILLTIPYGQAMTSGAVAGRIAAEQGRSRMSAQAVGGAVGHNPISLIIPCHRVIGADGSLTGYAGGLGRKQALLDMESKKR